MIGMLKRQPPQCVIPIQHACKVKVDGIEYPVIGYAPFYNVEVPGLYALAMPPSTMSKCPVCMPFRQRLT